MSYNIPAIKSFLRALNFGNDNRKKNKFKQYCFLLIVLLLLIAMTWFYMDKCYEVPVHHNSFSYLLSTHNTRFNHFDISSKIDIQYDYARQKETPSDTVSPISITTIVQCKSDSSTSTSNCIETKQFTQCLKESSAIIHKDWVSECYEQINKDDEYFDYLKKRGVAQPNRDNDSIDGTIFMIDQYNSNRQVFAVLFRDRFKYPERIHLKDSLIEENQHQFIYTKNTNCTIEGFPYFEKNVQRYDTIDWNHFLIYTKHELRKNAGRTCQYAYVPPSDSIIELETVFWRNTYKKPNPFSTAEDISSAIEVFGIEGDNDSTITLNLKRLSFDYTASTNFSAMFPKPDTIDVSRIVFVDSLKIDYIKKNGLKFHVHFPDYENLQEIRLFLVTLLLGGLLGLLMRVLYKMCRLWEDFWLEKMSKYWMWLAAALIIIVVAFALICIQSNVNAFDLYDDSTFLIYK